MRQHTVAVEAGEIEIQHDDVGADAVDLIQRLHTVTRFTDEVPVPLEQILHHLAEAVLVVDEQHLAGGNPLRAGGPRLRRLLQQIEMHRYRLRGRHRLGVIELGRTLHAAARRAAAPRRTGRRWDLHRRRFLLRHVDHAHELVDRRLALQDVRQAALPQRFHSMAPGDRRDLVGRFPAGDGALHLGAHGQHFEDREPAPVPGHRAVGAAGRAVQRRPGGEPALQLLGRGLHPDFLARLAQAPHQPLGDDAAQRRRDLVGLDADVDEARDRVGGVVGVQRRQHQVSGERRLDGDLRGLAVADLSHQHHIGVLPQDRAQRRCEGEPGLLLHLHLDDAGHPVFHRVFDRDDVHALALDLIDHRVQGRRFSRARRPRHENYAFVIPEQGADRLGLAGVQAQGVE